ncbi:acyltransferase family protein [Azospirillum doebereinerae]|uniref:Acyltransferase n=1 Tax=Azospirillum doebereinerae TaxID=92933 RepID=A0A433J7K7_9PROT|nr:acyltransferase [Azospirillum doebereinerae]RUQ69671.1 acyltransferase [Azospirillum doebereinerae]
MSNTPLLALALYGVALGVATLLLRLLPAGALPESGAGRFRAIDGLRGPLAYGVFIHHGVITWGWLYTGQWVAPESRLAVHLGQSSVALFFMVTAFLFWTRVLDSRSRMDWAAFALSRAYRLYPVYLLAWTGAVLIALASTGFAPKVDALSMVRSLIGWATFKTPAVNGMENAGQIVAYATWSLKYELLFYAALPGLAFLLRRSGRRAAALGSLGATVAVYAYFRGFSPVILACFLGGFAAAHWVRRPELAAFGRSAAGGAVALAALAGTVAGFDTAYAPLPLLGLSVVFLAIASGQSFGGVLAWRPVLWLGEISYGVYLLHGLVIWLALTGNAALPGAVREDGTLFAAALAGVGALVVLLASAVHLTVERPAMALGRRHAARLKTAPPRPALDSAGA